MYRRRARFLAIVLLVVGAVVLAAGCSGDGETGGVVLGDHDAQRHTGVIAARRPIAPRSGRRAAGLGVARGARCGGLHAMRGTDPT